MFIRSLSVLECTKLIAANQVARLACCHEGQPYLVPIHMAYADRHLYGFSMPGRKIAWMRNNPRVCVQVDELGPGRGWRSVVALGGYEELNDATENEQERIHAWRLISERPNWWEPGSLKPVQAVISDHYEHIFFRIVIDEISGRQAIESEK